MKKLFSVLTDNLGQCFITQNPNVAIHHVFGASNRKKSELRGFLVPLRPDYHNASNKGVHFNRELDLVFKRKAQEYYENNYGTRGEFIKEFGKSYL